MNQNNNCKKSQTEQRDLDFEKWFKNQAGILSKLDARRGWEAAIEKYRIKYETELMILRTSSRMAEHEAFLLKRDINRAMDILKIYKFKSADADDGPLVNI